MPSPARFINRIAFVTFSIVMSATVPITVAFAEQSTPKISALMIKQRHEYYGDLRVFITHDAIRVNFENKGIIVIAKAPSWTVVEYNPQTKTLFQRKFKDWMAHGNYLNATEDDPDEAFDDTRFKREGENKIGDEKATKYISNDPKRRSRYWIDEHIGCAPQAALIAERLLRLPLLKEGFPLELSSSTIWEKDKTSIVWLPPRMKKSAHPQFYCTLLTNDIKKLDVAKSDFDAPAHYRTVSNDQELWITPPTRSAMKMMIRALEPADAKSAGATSVHH